MDLVSVKPLQERFLKEEERYGRGYTSEICNRIGFVDKSGQPDTQRIKRKLGITQKGKGRYNKTMKYDDAVVVCRAMNVSPMEVDL